jgi:hypothetical protein
MANLRSEPILLARRPIKYQINKRWYTMNQLHFPVKGFKSLFPNP